MENISNFFERILQITEYYNIKSINSFAIEYLKYDSSEKINRLKKVGAFPSYQILSDIANKFEEIDMRWLITGTGKMIKRHSTEIGLTKKSENTIDTPTNITDASSLDFLLDRYEALVLENGTLKMRNKELELLTKKTSQTTKYKLTNTDKNIAAEPKP